MLIRHCQNKHLECKSIEAILREELDLNTAILDAMDALVVILDRQGYIVRFNNAFAKITGYTFDELSNQPFFELFLKQADKEPVKAIFNKLLSLESIFYESDLITKHGNCHRIAWSSIPFLDANGKVKYVISTGGNITVAKCLETECKQAQAQQTEALVKTLTASPVLDEFLGYILRSLTQSLDVPSGGIWLYDEAYHTTLLHIDYEDGQIRRGEDILRPGASKQKRLQQWDTEYMPLLMQNQILIQDVQNLPQSPEYALTHSYNHQRGIRTIMVIPLLFGGIFLGNITLRSTRRRKYKPEELELARMVAYGATLAIELTRLAQQTQYSACVESNRNTDEDDKWEQVSSVIVQQKHTNRDRVGSLPRQKLQQVIEYINNHLAENMSLAELAAIVQISPHYFSHWFKQSIGVSPHQYVIKCRVERAKQLLLTGEFTITQVASCVGFANQGHLNRHFKRFFGVNPKQIRQK